MSTNLKIIDRFKAHEIVQRLANSGLYAEMLGKERQKTIERRREILKRLATELPKCRAARERAATDFDQAQRRLSEADSAYKEADSAYRKAWCATMGADSTLRRLEGDAHRELRSLADPRIGDLRSHLEVLHERLRLCVDVELKEWQRELAGPRLTRHFNVDSIVSARDALRALLDRLDALMIADYGDDLRAQLMGILDQANAIVAPFAGRLASLSLKAEPYAIEE